MNIKGFTRNELEDTISRCKRALNDISDNDEKEREKEAERIKEAIFTVARDKYLDPLGEDETAFLAFLDAEMKKQQLYIEVPSNGIVKCSHDDCWYDNNTDRIEEYKSSYHYIFRHDWVMLCDVCCHNVDEDEYDIDEIYQDFCHWYRSKKNKK
jgi:hypothetical protein